MSTYTEKEGFPPHPLRAGMEIRLEAISPTTGDPVADVTADRWTIYGYDKSDGPPLTDEVPRWTPEDAEV